MTVLPILEQIDCAFGAGQPVPCRAGCVACCHGPFDISPADALALEAGMTALDDVARARLVARARDEIAAFRQVRPDWQLPYSIESLGDDGFDAIAELRADEPCPALDATGVCAIYRHRPSTCRLMGRSWLTADGEILGNDCPIVDRFSGYSDVPAASIDLDAVESALEDIDVAQVALGWPSTTIAGAIVRWVATNPPSR